MTFQLVLHVSGQIDFVYGPTVTNNSTFGGVSDNGIIGVSQGAPATLPPGVDLSTSPSSTAWTTYEAFLVANTMDMAGDTLTWTPASPGPGWAITRTPGGATANCATKSLFGTGCYDRFASFYEDGPFDLSNTSLLFTSGGPSYIVLPGTTGITPPTGTPVAMADDIVLTFALGWTLPYPGGTTTSLWISSNGFIHGANQTASGCCSFNLSMFLSSGPVWSALWDDLNPAAGGTVTFQTDTVNQNALITFDQVPEFGTSNVNTFQYYFDATGTVELRWGSCAVASAGVGWSPGQNNLDPGSIDISATPVIITSPADALALAIDGSSRPVIGSTVTLTVSNIPAGSPIAAVIFGLQKFDPGINLTTIGMPDCFQYCSQDAVALILSPGLTATSTFSSPNVPALAGLHIITQGAAYNPSAFANTMGAGSSNGVDLGLDVN